MKQAESFSFSQLSFVFALLCEIMIVVLLFCKNILIKPLHLYISMQILHTVLNYTFPLVLTRRICVSITAF